MKDSSQNGARRRLYLLIAFFGFWLCAISARLVWLQVIRFGDLTLRAARLHERSIDLAPQRGIIYDRNGQEMAMTVQVDSVFAVPAEIPDQPSTASVLSKILKIDNRELLRRMQLSRAFCWVARKLDPADSDRVRALNLKGVYFQKEAKRFYPKHELAAQVLGYVGLDDNGLAGLEREFDPKLRGETGKMQVSLDARRRSLQSAESQAKPGENLVLTIDENIQYIAERELEAAMRQTHAETGTVVVQNPRTGEILALASRPTFNPNTFHVSDPKTLKNHAVSDVYEPGSTFKLVTLSAALEEKLTRPTEMVDCQMGAIWINGVRIRDHKPYGLLSVTDVLADSSDVGAIKIGMRLGNDRFYKYIRDFGFGSRTGIELPGETRGMVKPVKRWSKVSIGAISMGQEVAVTPLQLISMVSAIANDGIYNPPRILAGEVPANGSIQNVAFHPNAADQHRVISSMTAAEMRQMMERTVLQGTGKEAILDGYTSAGKTGTAQKADPATHRYSTTKLVASFAGFAPVNNPVVSIAVILDSPQGGHMGGEVAAPVFNRVAQQVLAYMNVPHDAEVRSRQRELLRASAKPEDFEEGSPDRLGESGELLAMIDQKNERKNEADSSSRNESSTDPGAGADTRLVPAGYTVPVRNASRQNGASQAATASSSTRNAAPRVTPAPVSAATVAVGSSNTGNAGSSPARDRSQQAASARNGVVVDIGQAIAVPSFLGETVRGAVEMAEDAGIEIIVVGDGVARQQMPAPGTRVPSGGKVKVVFSR